MPLKKTTLYAEPAVEDYDHYTFFNLDGHIPYMGVGTFLKKLKLTGISLSGSVVLFRTNHNYEYPIFIADYDH